MILPNKKPFKIILRLIVFIFVFVSFGLILASVALASCSDSGCYSIIGRHGCSNQNQDFCDYDAGFDEWMGETSVGSSACSDFNGGAGCIDPNPYCRWHENWTGDCGQCWCGPQSTCDFCGDTDPCSGGETCDEWPGECILLDRNEADCDCDANCSTGFCYQVPGDAADYCCNSGEVWVTGGVGCHSRIPNCSGLTGPTSLTVGQSGYYHADFFSPEGELRGRIGEGNYNSFADHTSDGNNLTNVGGNWTPAASGSYLITCRAWNDAIAECRYGPHVDQQPRYPCDGPNNYMWVAVSDPTPTPRPTNTPVPPTATPRPTNTPVPPTATPRPTNTPVPGDPECTLNLSPSSATINEGDTESFTATISNVLNGSVSNVTFSSSNTSVATVSPSSDSSVAYLTLATGQSGGTAVITAQGFMDGASRCSDSSTLTVFAPDPTATPTPIPTNTPRPTPTTAGCYCSSWANQSCGGGSCPDDERLQTRNCDPDDCLSESQCDPDPSCLDLDCTVNLSPSSGSVDVGETMSFTAAVDDVVGTVERVSFSSSNTSIATVLPSSDSSVPYRTTATGESAGSTTITARVRMDGSYICSDTSSITVNAVVGRCNRPDEPDPVQTWCDGDEFDVRWEWDAVWDNDGGDWVEEYSFHLDDDSDFSSLVENSTFQHASNFNCGRGGTCDYRVNNLSIGTIYYARVRGRGSVCTRSTWSSTGSVDDDCPVGCVWVQGECWDEHIREGDPPQDHQFVPPDDPAIGLLEEVELQMFWQWSGNPDQTGPNEQTNEDHEVDTPFGTSVCNDLGSIELEDQWLNCVSGPSSFTDFWTVADGNVPVTLRFTGDDSSAGSHYSRVCAWWCTLPPQPTPEPTPTPFYCEQPDLSSEFVCLNETGGSFTFDNVNISQGASIADARLNLYARERFGDLNLNIGAEGVGAQASWNFTPGSGWNQSSNLASVIQAVVAQPGWSSGDSITILVTDNGSTGSWSVSAWDLSPSEAAELTVNYDVGGVFNGQVNDSEDDYFIGDGEDFYNYRLAWPLIPMGGQSVTVNWHWLPVSDSLGLGDQMYYQFQLAWDSSFTNLIFDTGVNFELTEVTTPGLEQGETYWARVRTHDHCATSPWTVISENLDCAFATPCDISLTGPSSVTLLDTQTYRVQINDLIGTVDRVDFTSSDSSVGSICDESLASCPPGSANDSDSDATYNTNLTAYSFGTTTIDADMIIGGLARCSASIDVGITNPPPWWQAVGGSAVAGGSIAGTGSITSIISAGCVLPVCNPFIVVGDGMPIADTTVNPGSGGVSESTWSVEGSPYEGDDYDYSYFRNKLRVVPDALSASTADETTFTSGGTLLGRHHYYSYDGSLGDLDIEAISSLHDGTNPRRVVLFVTGAVTKLNQNIDFLDGSELFMIITDDDINVNETVTLIEGIYVADGNFNTCVDGTGADCSGTTSELTLRGTVVASQVDMNRDLLDNSQTPAEVFEFSPGTLMGFPWALGDMKITWEEVAP